MFPFDREAIDYERIQRECFAVEDDDDDDDDNNEADAAPVRRNGVRGRAFSTYPSDGDGYEAANETSLDSPDLVYGRTYGASGHRKAGSSSRLEKFEYEVSNLMFHVTVIVVGLQYGIK